MTPIHDPEPATPPVEVFGLGDTIGKLRPPKQPESSGLALRPWGFQGGEERNQRTLVSEA